MVRFRFSGLDLGAFDLLPVRPFDLLVGRPRFSGVLVSLVIDRNAIIFFFHTEPENVLYFLMSRKEINTHKI